MKCTVTRLSAGKARETAGQSLGGWVELPGQPESHSTAAALGHQAAPAEKLRSAHWQPGRCPGLPGI